MGTGGYKIRNTAGIHFVTFAVVEWIDVFSRKLYKDLLVDSLRYCQLNKDLNLYAWCLMTNHLHMIMSARNHDCSGILRDFKKFTSKQLLAAIEDNPHESRRDWMMPIFRSQGEQNSNNTKYQFWRHDNHPIEIYSPAFAAQKINYIHNNPVIEGVVERPENYLYSSARDYHYKQKCGLLDVLFL
jgi:putative transposase